MLSNVPFRSNYLHNIVLGCQHKVPIGQTNREIRQRRQCLTIDRVLSINCFERTNEIMNDVDFSRWANDQTGAGVGNRLTSTGAQQRCFWWVQFFADKCGLSHFELIIAFARHRNQHHVAGVMVFIASAPCDHATDFAAAQFVQIHAPDFIANTALLLHQINWWYTRTFGNISECRAQYAIHWCVDEGFARLLHRQTDHLIFQRTTTNLLDEIGEINGWKGNSRLPLSYRNRVDTFRSH